MPAPLDLVPRPCSVTLDGRHVPDTTIVVESVDAAVARPQGYRVTLAPGRVDLIGHDAAGLFYARQTLAQLRRLYRIELPTGAIEDWPDFPVRGVMLDISRDKVPTMATLFMVVDLFA